MNENPEGTPNPLNPAPGTENEMAAGTGLGFVETEQVSETMAEPETPEAPAEAPEVAELGKIEETSITSESVKPASFAEAAGESITVETPAEPVPEPEPEPEPVEPEPAPEPIHINRTTVDPMMKPVSHNNFDTLGMDNATANDAPAEEIKEETFVRSETPMTLTPASDMPELVAKDSIVEPVGGGGKKKALIIGAIVLVLVAIICSSVAIAIMMIGNNDDRVSRAIDKLINGEVSTIIAAKGDISATTSTAEAATNINFDGIFDLKSPMNQITATVNTNLASGTNVSIDVDELRNKDGDTYFRISGLTDLTNSDNAITTNCAGDNSGLTNCQPQGGEMDASALLSMYSGLFQVVDDEWILVSGDFSGNMGDLELFDNGTTCLVNALNSLPQYSKDIANKYKQNQFITYSTENLGIGKRQNNLYRLGFDEEKMAAFINSLSNNGFMNELNACAGEVATNSDITVDKIKEIFNGFPTVYVEINDKFDFTRVRLEATTAIEGTNDSTTITADLSLSYPTSFSVDEPTEYTDMSTLLNKVMTNLLTSGATI